MNMKKKIYQKNRPMRLLTGGFSLVETLVAVTLLLIAVAGVMNMAQGGLQLAVAARDQMVATYLAQEATEYIRNIRDSNHLAEDAWDKGFSDCSNACRLDVTLPASAGGITGCPGGVCPFLRYDEENARYYYDPNKPQSRFHRKVVISPVRNDSDGTAEYIVEVIVSWAGTKGGNSLRLVSSLHRRN